MTPSTSSHIVLFGVLSMFGPPKIDSSWTRNSISIAAFSMGPRSALENLSSPFLFSLGSIHRKVIDSELPWIGLFAPWSEAVDWQHFSRTRSGEKCQRVEHNWSRGQFKGVGGESPVRSILTKHLTLTLVSDIQSTGAFPRCVRQCGYCRRKITPTEIRSLFIIHSYC